MARSRFERPPHDELLEALPRLAVQLDVAAIAVLARPLLATAAPDAPLLCELASFHARASRLLEPPRALQIELIRIGLARHIHADDPDYGGWLRAQRLSSVQVRPGPRDRLPTVFFFCYAHRPPRPDATLARLGHAALDALAERLAPPHWLPPASGAFAGKQPPAAARRAEALQPIREAVEEVERILLRRALRVAEGNKSLAARSLRMTRSALYRKLRRHGLLED